MSELNDIKKALDELKSMVEVHIAKTETYRKERDKVVDAHSDALWDMRGNAGLVTEVDRIKEFLKSEKEKKLQNSKESLAWRIVIATPIIGLLAESFWRNFIKH